MIEEILKSIEKTSKFRIGIMQLDYAITGNESIWGFDSLMEIDDFSYLENEKNKNMRISSFYKMLGNHDKILEFQQMIESDYNEWICGKIKAIMEHADDYKVDLLVFPELSIPAKCLRFLQDKVNQTNIVVIAGSHYVRQQDIREGIYSKINLLINKPNTNLSPILFANKSPTYVTKKTLFGPEVGRVIPGDGPKIIEIPNTKYTFGLFICKDFISDIGKDFILKHIDKINFIVVAAYTESVDQFEDNASLRISRPAKPVIFVNATRFGGSTAFASYYQKESFGLDDYDKRKNCFSPIPQGEEALFILDVDLEQPDLFLRESQNTNVLPSKRIAILPFLYDEKVFSGTELEKITYKDFMNSLFLNNGHIDKSRLLDFIKNTPFFHIEVERKSKLLAQKFERINPNSINALTEADIYQIIYTILVDEEAPNLWEFRYLHMFGITQLFIKDIMINDVDTIKNKANELIRQYATRQEDYINDRNITIRGYYKKFLSIADHIEPNQAELILIKRGLTREELELEISRLKEIGLNRGSSISWLVAHSLDLSKDKIAIIVPKSKDECITLLEEINGFITSLVENQYDYYSLIERKGFRLFNLVYGDNDPIWRKVISPKKRRLKYYPTQKLDMKKILIFDDMMGEGKHMIEAETELKGFLHERGYKPKILDRSVFVTRRDCPQALLPIHGFSRYSGVSDTKYKELSSKVRKLFFYKGMTLDTEHIEFILSCDKGIGFTDLFLDVLKSFTGTFSEIAKSDLSSSYKTIQVSVNGTDILAQSEFKAPSRFIQEGISKIRFYISDNKIRCIPIVYYAVPFNYQPDKNRDCKNWVFQFCSNDLNVWDSASVCYDCVSFNASLELGKYFLKCLISKLRSKNIQDIKFMEISKISLLVCYNCVYTKWMQNISDIENQLKEL